MRTFQFLFVQPSFRQILKHTCGYVTNLQPSIHCLIMQLKLIFMALKLLFLAPVYLFSLITFGSFHKHNLQPWSLSHIVQEAHTVSSVSLSFAHNSIQCSYSPFNLQLRPLISQKTWLDSGSLGLVPILHACACMQCTYLYTEFITVL